MRYFEPASLVRNVNRRDWSRRQVAGLILVLLGFVAGCGKESKKPGQALAKVDGQEITALQLNEELKFADSTRPEDDAVRARLLEALIDRQLLQDAAARDKTDRSPEVVKAVERAKAVIIAQAYMQKRLQLLARPSQAEIRAYFEKEPSLFSHRQQYDLNLLLFLQEPAPDIVEQLVKNAATIDEAAAWLTANDIAFARNAISPTSTDLPPELVDRLKATPIGRIVMLKQGGKDALIAVSAIKDVPVDFHLAAPKIEQYMMSVKSKEAAAAELARLRANANIEYVKDLTGGIRQAQISDTKSLP